jgi:hypothetical protein
MALTKTKKPKPTAPNIHRKETTKSEEKNNKKPTQKWTTKKPTPSIIIIKKSPTRRRTEKRRKSSRVEEIAAAKAEIGIAIARNDLDHDLAPKSQRRPPQKKRTWSSRVAKIKSHHRVNQREEPVRDQGRGHDRDHARDRLGIAHEIRIDIGILAHGRDLDRIAEVIDVEIVHEIETAPAIVHEIARETQDTDTPNRQS